MGDLILWWLVLQLVGLAALPMTARLLARLPDGGILFARPLGLLLLGYGVWIAAMLHLLPFGRGSALLVLVLIGLASLILAVRQQDEWMSFFRSRWRAIAGGEALFLGAFLLMAFVRSFNPEITGTEKPMDFAFVNGILRSEFFPPNDPWLAGHSISYYYFGHALVAVLIALSGVPSSVGYNLALATFFAMAVTGAYTLGMALVSQASERFVHAERKPAAATAPVGKSQPVAAPVAAARGRGSVRPGATLTWDGPALHAKAAGNGAAGDESPPPAGLAMPADPGEGRWLAAPSQPRFAAPLVGILAALLLVGISNLQGGLEFVRAQNVGSHAFWQWVGVDGALEPYQSTRWYPDDPGWWWWRATRLINTLDITTDPTGRAVRADASADYTITEFPFFSFLLGDLHPHVMALPFGLLALAVALHLARSTEPFGRTWARREMPWLALASLTVGALGFLNSWDFPTYFVIFTGAALLAVLLRHRTLNATAVREVAWVAGPVVVLAIALFLPFYIGFRSQASGIQPVLGPGTRPLHFVLFWGVLLFAVVSFLVVDLIQRRNGSSVRRGLPAGLLPLAPVAVWLLVVAAMAQFQIGRVPALALYTLLAVMPWVLVYRHLRAPVPANRSTLFALLLVAIAFTLTLGCELFYVKDVFSSRMNTIFKFYYQAWVLLAIAAAFGIYAVVSEWRAGLVRTLAIGGWAIAGGVMLFGSLLYPAGATLAKTNSFAGPPTLDGTAFVQRTNPAEAEAIAWLNQHAPSGAVVVEAVGGQYSEFARVSARTGIPTLLGWPGHQNQWRGSDAAFRGRDQEVSQIYQAADVGTLRSLLEKYNVTYVYFGHLERSTYGVTSRERLARHLDVAFQNAGVTIFKRRGL